MVHISISSETPDHRTPDHRTPDHRTPDQNKLGPTKFQHFAKSAETLMINSQELDVRENLVIPLQHLHHSTRHLQHLQH